MLFAVGNKYLDIQDFYDNVLLNERLSFGQKTLEAQNFARRWDAAGPNLIGQGLKPSLAPFPATYSRPSSTLGQVVNGIERKA